MKENEIKMWAGGKWRHIPGQWPHEKMLNIISHKGNAIKTKMKYH